MFFKKIVLVSNKILAKNISNFSFLAYLLVLKILLIFNTNPRFFIIS